MANNKLAEDLVQMHAALKSKRQPFEAFWKEISEYMLPYPLKFEKGGDVTPQDIRPPNEIIESTAREALAIFSAGMLSGVSNPSSNWFKFQVATTGPEDNINEQPEVATWLFYIEDLIRSIMMSRNYYGQQVAEYDYLGTIGHGTMLIDANLKDKQFIFRNIPPDSVCIAEDSSGFANVIFRAIQMTGAQMIERFGEENLSKDLRNQIGGSNSAKTQMYGVVHAVIKKDAGYKNLMGKNQLTYAGYYFEDQTNHLIEEGGYNTMPYIVTRAFHRGDSAYSHSYGGMVLADCKMLNEMKRLQLKAQQVGIAPPLLAPQNKLLLNFTFEPWSINMYNKHDGIDAQDFMPLPISADPRMIDSGIAAYEAKIHAAFNVDLFLTMKQRTAGSKGTPTAQEVIALQQERAQILGPLIINLQQENFNRTHSRIYDLLGTMGMVPEPPSALNGRELELVYLSPLMMAQQGLNATTVMAAFTELTQTYGTIDPEVIDNFDLDKLARFTAKLKGIPNTGFRTAQEVEALRVQRAQQQQEQMQQMQQQQVAAALPDAYAKTTKRPEDGSMAQTMMKQGG